MAVFSNLMLAFVLSFFLLSSPCILAVSDTWNGETYHEFSQSQSNTANTFLARYKFLGYEQVLDVGCGSGNVSASIAELLPKGSVVGVDISPSMIDFAQTNFSDITNISFSLKDAATLDFEQKFDVAVSFTALHFVQNQLSALQGIRKSLKPLGYVMIQMPTMPAALDTAIKDLINKEQWYGYFIDFKPEWRFYFPNEYTGLLEDAGLKPLRVELVEYEDVFASKDAFQNFVGQWLPYLQPLPEDQKQLFLSSLIDRYLEIMPADTLGQVHFTVDRLEAEAINPNNS